MKNKPNFTRRQFVKNSSLAAFTLPYIVPSTVLTRNGRISPNDKINLGIIGCGGLGKANLNACMQDEGVELVAACDVWEERLNPILDQYSDTCTGYHDYRKLLEHPDLDAVIIATPAHWHALQAIASAEAGVDVYLQKPMSMFPAESIAIRNAFRNHGTINQIGTQIHSGDHYRRMVELVRSGNLGDIGTVRTFFVMNEAPDGIGSGNNTEAPNGLDWQQWVGPSPMQSFNPYLVKDAFYHCFWMDFSGGWTPGMAPHITDLPIWAMELDYPTEVSAMGGRYIIRDDGDAYDNHEVIWQYPDLTMTWMNSSTNSHGWAFQNSDKDGVGYETGTRRRLGIYFHGVNGTLITDYDTHILVPEGDRMDGMATPEESIASSPGQELEWLEGVRSGQQPLCNADYHIKVDMPIQLSILSLKLGRSIKFDPETEKIVDDKDASRQAIPEYRSPWKFPKEYL